LPRPSQPAARLFLVIDAELADDAVQIGRTETTFNEPERS
jgi:hypothetical protein